MVRIMKLAAVLLKSDLGIEHTWQILERYKEANTFKPILLLMFVRHEPTLTVQHLKDAPLSGRLRPYPSARLA